MDLKAINPTNKGHPVNLGGLFKSQEAWRSIGTFKTILISKIPMNPTFHVLNENALGFIYAETPNYLCVLADKVWKGGHDWKNGPVYIDRSFDKIRKATKEDFEYYRVSIGSHVI